MSLVLAGIGTAVPAHSIEQREAAGIVAPFCCTTDEQERQLKALYRLSGVRTRHSVLLESSSNSRAARQSFYTDPGTDGPSTADRMLRYEQDAAPLALSAAQAALTEAETSPVEVTHLVSVSCSGFAAPGFDLALMRDLPLPAATARTHLGFMGCHGMLNGLRVARAFTEADPRACVLLCAVELCSLHQQYGWRPDQIVANALFSDGAAAAVVRQATETATADWRVTASGSTVIPETADLMEWHIRDHGFEMVLSPQVPEVIRRELRPWLADWLANHGLTIEAVGSWAVHPGGPRILQATAQAAGFEAAHLDDSQQILARYGNMSSATLLFILERLRRRNAPRPCLALAYGPGLTIEAALME
jgi:predicted naringenin-chalcone synthase